MAEYTKEIGLTITCMAKVPTHGATDVNMKAITLTIKNMGKVRTFGQTVALTKADGRMVSRTGVASTDNLMAGYVKESGVKENAHTGKMRSAHQDSIRFSHKKQWVRQQYHLGLMHIRTIHDEADEKITPAVLSRALKRGKQGCHTQHCSQLSLYKDRNNGL